MSQQRSDQARRVENMLSVGTIAEVDDAGGRLRLSISGRLTNWIPYPATVGRNCTVWQPARVGTQVLAACPSGDPANAVVAQMLYSNSVPRPEQSSNIDVIKFNDGTTVQYDSGAGILTIIAPKVVIKGDVEVDGAITATGSIIDSGGNTNHHSH